MMSCQDSTSYDIISQHQFLSNYIRESITFMISLKYYNIVYHYIIYRRWIVTIIYDLLFILIIATILTIYIKVLFSFSFAEIP